MSKNDQNTCLETPDTTPNARLRYLSSYEDIPTLILALVCKILKAKSVLRKRFKQYNYITIHYNARAPCAIIRKIALKGLFFCLSQSKSVSRVNIHSGSDICSLLPGNCNALPRIWRPKLAEHFPSTRIAIIGIDYFAISRDCSEL